MKKNTMKIVCLILQVFILAFASCGEVCAATTTSYTYTLDADDEYRRTQDAYLPDDTITDLGLASPQDLFYAGNTLYIADTGNSRIVLYNTKTKEVEDILTCDAFVNPCGLYITSDGMCYVADSGAKAILIFDKKGKLVNQIGKPESPLFVDGKFEPSKVAVDNGKNMYVVGEGVYSGIIQLAETGDFLGYFTVNKTKLTPLQTIRRLLATRDQLKNLVDVVPNTFSNVFVDSSNIVYTTTMGDEENGLKKHDMAGNNMFNDAVPGQTSMMDVWVDDSGMIYVASTLGYIDVYSRNGELVFEFGSADTDQDIAGLYKELSAICVDDDGRVWTVDKQRGYLQSFSPTEYTLNVYAAMDLYEHGEYEAAEEKWEGVLRLNQMSILAHNGIGKTCLRAQDYEKAMEHFEVAENRDYYSEAFWEVRNTWIQAYLGPVLGILIVVWLLSKIYTAIRRKKYPDAKKLSLWERTAGMPVVSEMCYSLKMPRHPMDTYYEIRAGRRGNVVSATILYVIFFVLYMVYKTGKGFIYQFVKVEDMDIGAIVMGFFVLLGMFIICNWLSSSIHDGNGTLKKIYMVPAYGMIPAAVAMISVIVLSYVMTENEAFMLTIIMVIGVAWTCILIFVGLQTIHDYTISETIKDLIRTVLFMVICIVVLLIVIIMWEQLYQFVLSVGRELVRNVID